MATCPVSFWIYSSAQWCAGVLPVAAFPCPNKKSAREASLPMVGRRSGCAFRWESGKLRYAMKHHFLAWMEVAIISFLGLRSPLPRIAILPVHARLGLFTPSLVQKTQQKKRMQTSPWPTGDCPRALSYLVLQFGLVRTGLTSYGSAPRQSGIERIIRSSWSSVK